MNIVRVSDVGDLRAEASNFQTHADEVKTLTSSMLQAVEATKSVWRGEAQVKYSTQFAGLQDDMDLLYKICSEYSTDLTEIANTYETAENDNVATASATRADIVMA